MSRRCAIALVVLLVGMPATVWAGHGAETTVDTDKAATGETRKEKRHGGHARLGNVEAAPPTGGNDGHEASATADAPSTLLPSVTTTQGGAIE